MYFMCLCSVVIDVQIIAEFRCGIVACVVRDAMIENIWTEWVSFPTYEMTDENQSVKRVWVTDLLVISVKKLKSPRSEVNLFKTY